MKRRMRIKKRNAGYRGLFVWSFALMCFIGGIENNTTSFGIGVAGAVICIALIIRATKLIERYEEK